MKVNTISNDHYIIVDDSEIKEGDGIIDSLGIRQVTSCEGVKAVQDVNHIKKITHSTQPLEEGTTIHDIEHKRWILIKYIDLQEVKELIGEVDVEKRIYDTDFRGDVNSYKQGYNQAREDNKKKKYTEEDMWKAFEYGKTLDGYDWFGDLLESLQPKTEWEVEIIDGKLKLV